MSVLPVQDSEDIRNDAVVSEDGVALLGSEALDPILPLVIELPDGQFITVEALLAAVTTGASAVQGEAGTEIPIEFVYEILTKELGKVGVEGEIGDEPLGGQASFRDASTLEFLDALLLSGRIHSSDGQTSSLSEITRRSKSKDMSSDTLREILVDGPDAGNDVITPLSKDEGHVTMLAFSEVAISNSWPPEMQRDGAIGNLLKNDSSGDSKAPTMTGITYNGVSYLSSKGVIVVEEPDVWRLTVYSGGLDAVTGRINGDYVFEFYGPYNHSQTIDEYETFSLAYTIVNGSGETDTAAIQFCIRDGVPVAEDDFNSVIAGGSTFGSVFANDTIGGDGFGGFVEISGDIGLATAEQANSNGTVTIAGSYGELLFNVLDGSYEYRTYDDGLTATSVEVNDAFRYTFVDGDGDAATAELNVIVRPGEPIVKPVPPPNPTDDPGDVDAGTVYIWSSYKSIDADGNGAVDLNEVIKGFDPNRDRLDIDGLLRSLGYDDANAASSVFKLVDTADGVSMQIDLGGGWESFVTVSNSPPLLLNDVENAIVS